MAVQREMAAIYPPDGEALSQLLPETDCGQCGFAGCIEFAEALIAKQPTSSSCPDLDREFTDMLDSILMLNQDPIPYNMMMDQEPCTLLEIWKALKENAVGARIGKTVMVIPGLAEKEKNSIRQMTGWNVLVGPVSGFLAPLFILKNQDVFL